MQISAVIRIVSVSETHLILYYFTVFLIANW